MSWESLLTVMIWYVPPSLDFDWLVRDNRHFTSLEVFQKLKYFQLKVLRVQREREKKLNAECGLTPTTLSTSKDCIDASRSSSLMKISSSPTRPWSELHEFQTDQNCSNSSHQAIGLRMRKASVLKMCAVSLCWDKTSLLHLNIWSVVAGGFLVRALKSRFFFVLFQISHSTNIIVSLSLHLPYKNMQALGGNEMHSLLLCFFFGYF